MTDQTVNPAEFWDRRARAVGHTGYSDQLVYAYDQQARLRAVAHVLDELGAGHTTALDLGTGSGDFIPLLLERFSEVIAFDISAEVIGIASQRHRGQPRSRFICGPSVTGIDLADGALDLVLSITTLGHIMDPAQIDATLAWVARKLRPGGRLVALERTLTAPRAAASYQYFRTRAEWTDLLSGAGMPVTEQYGFYHPDEAPCPSFRAYATDFWVRSIRRARLARLARGLCRRVAARCLAGKLDFLQPGAEHAPMTIMVARKETGP